MSRILVVDDDALQLDLHKQILEIAGYQVQVAQSSPGTVRCLEKAPADLVIMDLRFHNDEGVSDPRVGIALIRRIRDLGCRAPVIVLSGWPEDLYGQAEERMVSRILVKPVRTSELLHTIGELLA